MIDVHLQVANISWSPVQQPTVESYTMTVTSSNMRPQSFQLDTSPYFMFTAPEGVPPCEIYNFSVTATYVGATYTGAGCSVPSPVISRNLPILPDITKFEAYLLQKESSGVVTLRLLIVRYLHYLDFKQSC